MKKYRRNILILIIVSFVDAFGGNLTESKTTLSSFNEWTATKQSADTVRIDTTGVLPYNFKDEPEFAYPDKKDSSKLFLKNPSNIHTDVEYDPVSGEYIFTEKVGDLEYRLPKTMTRKEFEKYDFDQAVQNYWRNQTKIKAIEDKGGLIPKLTVGGEAFSKIFGSNTIDIRPQGFVEVSFGYQMNSTQNPAIPERLRKVPSFDFNQKIQMNVTGKIGDRMEMRVNYNTEATFDYENKMNLAYTGDEDQIVKKIEAGNVSLPLNGSLITGGSNLFGVKTELQFGKLNVTTIFSQHKGETQVIESEGGAQKKTFEIKASDYDANRHFFLAQYFRDHYDEALKNLPIVKSSITINKIEVWVTNKSGNFKEARNILALMDLGEHKANLSNNIPAFQETPGAIYPESVYPYNQANGLYEQMTTVYSSIRQSDNINKTMAPLAASNFTGGKDFEKIEQARLLNTSEYSINPNLGYISLKSALNADEVLAVAFNYTANGKTYQVGEFSTDGITAPQTLVLKLLKGTNLSPKLPTWKLMMKNIYDLNAYQLTKDEFVLDIMYQNDKTGNYINYIPEGRINGHILLNVLNLDKLNSQLDLVRDGVFDYVEGITVNSSTGKIIFPVLEPFGKNLGDSIIENVNDSTLVKKYSYFSLYKNTKTIAEQDAEHNKFVLKGSYKGASSSEIMASSQNLARGSVKVTTGGRTLVENVDYTVDYASGIVKIINTGLLESGSPIQVSTESQDLFSMQRKTLIGAHANYAISDRFNLGATVLHMQERPLTQKVNYGDDPISNTILGMDASYSNESMFLTKLVDKLPFYSTKAPSSIAFDGEIAQLIPGHSKVINKSGTVYIDDFEATKTSIDLKLRSAWALASTPQLQPDLFPEAETNGSLSYGFNRAKLAWYEIDPLFLRNSSNTPDYIKKDVKQLSNDLVREVYEKELFPDRETPVGQPTNIPTFDLAYYPSERGPYNYDTRLNSDGSLQNPGSRWGGIMRRIETSDFEAANIEFIEFWVMDPFINDSLQTSKGGDLYFNLGDVSEDILKDSRKSFENGLPTTAEPTNVDTTIWGRVSTQQSMVREFDNNIQSRRYQDIGLDGLNDNDEAIKFKGYLDVIKTIVNPDTVNAIFKDPSGDDFHYYRGRDYDRKKLGILERYKNYNGTEGNSRTAEMSPEPYSTTASSIPDMEDINGDNTLNEYEKYYQYRISIRREDFVVGKNYITDVKDSHAPLKNGGTSKVKWYQFKIPVKSPNAGVFGSISDFKSIRFMRMFMKGFSDPTVLRFATFDLVRSEWRRYTKDVNGGIGVVAPQTQFDISAVNIEENSRRQPVNYVLPPGIDRVIDPANPQLRQLNEQSLLLRAVDLLPGDARAAYKNLNMDFRNYKHLQLEVHAEAVKDRTLNANELSLFVRVGSDYYNNYYEYEIPLTPTSPGYYNGDDQEARKKVWPEENKMDLALEAFTNLKLKRNDAMRQAGSTTTLNQEYIAMDGNRILKIKGNPNLSNVEVMMVGIRNNYADSKDPRGSSAEVWLNELRLSDLEEGGGWAATGRVTARLADLGSVVFAGRTRSAGFGSIEQKVNQRAMDELTELDISANLEMGKFFPEKAQVKVPLYVGYSESRSNPKYNPLDPDIKMKDALHAAGSRAEKDSIKRVAQEVVTRKSINLTNIKIDKSSKSGKPKVYDPTNFSVTYSYSELNKRSINVEENLDKNHRGMFSYNFNGRPESIEPFKKSKVLNKQAFRLIKDFNFALAPAQFSFRTDMWRHYNEIQLRNISNPNMIIPRTFNKDFIWNKYYDLHYNLTRSLQFDFTSQGTARIDELEGSYNRNDEDYAKKKKVIMDNIMALGRPTLYHHLINATYMTPINKLPLLDWTSLSATYRGMYDWQAGPITSKDVILGNTIENSRQATLNGQLNLVSLYNKVDFLKEINQKYGTSSRQLQRQNRPRQGQAGQQKQQSNTAKAANEPKVKEVEYTTDNVRLRAKTPKSIFHKLKTRDVEVTAVDKDGAPVAGQVAVVNENRVTFTPEANASGVRFVVKGKIQKDGDLGQKLIQYTARALMGVRTISLTYSLTDGTVLPGFMPTPKVIGLGRYNPNDAMYGDLPSSSAPGLPFLLGWQDEGFARRAADKGWITRDTALNQPFVMSKSEQYNFRAQIEPMPDLRIELTANRTYSERTTQFYNASSGDFVNKKIQGNFTMSVNTMKTAFSKMGNSGNTPASAAFEKLKENRMIIAQRLASQRIANAAVGYNPADIDPSTGFPVGYGPTSSQVLVPAFIAAYTGQSAEKVSLNPFPSLIHMRPNWRITYEGVVAQSEFLKRYFKTLSFSHAYRSSYNVGSFMSNLNYAEEEDGFSYARNTIGNTQDFLGKYDINSVSISEQFSPLINMEITWLNDLETRAELKTSRNLALSFSNNQLMEVLSNEMTFGLGYRFSKMDLIVKTKKSQKAYSNDLNIRGDLSFRKNKTILRKIVEGDEQLQSGQGSVTLKTTADYMLSDRFQLRVYFDKILNNPYKGSFNTSNTSLGVSFRFTLAQ
ncbi:MAG: cell surface protein SprA [Candidatus Saccharibacteria bacterium]